MTNKEYLQKSLGGLDVSEDDIDVILVKGEIDGNADVDVNACDRAVYNRMSVILKSMLMNVSEGGYSISWNMEAVKLYYSALCNELGKENVLEPKPVVYDGSDFW